MKLKRDSYLATIYTSLISREYVCSALIFCESNTFRDQLKNRKVFMLAKFAIKPYLNGRFEKTTCFATLQASKQGYAFYFICNTYSSIRRRIPSLSCSATKVFEESSMDLSLHEFVRYLLRLRAYF